SHAPHPAARPRMVRLRIRGLGSDRRGGGAADLVAEARAARARHLHAAAALAGSAPFFRGGKTHSLAPRSPYVNTPRVVLALCLIACGHPPDANEMEASSQALLGVPTPLPVGPLCIGPACVGQSLESVSLGPIAPPTMPTVPLGPTPPPPLPITIPNICPVTSVAMQVLVISADGTEPSLQSIQQALGFHTIPFTPWIATKNPGMLTADKLATNCD